MNPTSRTIARRRASRRIQRAWTRTYLSPTRTCRACGCPAAHHGEYDTLRTGARCRCSCFGYESGYKKAHGRRWVRRGRRLEAAHYREIELHIIGLRHSVERWRRGLIASYTYKARRKVNEDDMLMSLGDVAYERQYIAGLIAEIHRYKKVLALGRWSA